ncbi:MAG: hypothetical protein PHP42_13845 [Bacteroidota bacterium]|nr:hypothetical protein [Bacteroidota bacterium]
MKTRIAMIALAVMIAVSTMAAQESFPAKNYALNKKQTECAKKNIMMGLRSGNDGVAEAALMLIAKIKIQEPAVRSVEIQKVVDSLAVSSPSNAMRYKAYIVSNICIDPEWYAQDNKVVASKTETFFIAAAQRMQYKLFGTSSL